MKRTTSAISRSCSRRREIHLKTLIERSSKPRPPRPDSPALYPTFAHQGGEVAGGIGGQARDASDHRIVAGADDDAITVTIHHERAAEDDVVRLLRVVGHLLDRGAHGDGLARERGIVDLIIREE